MIPIVTEVKVDPKNAWIIKEAFQHLADTYSERDLVDVAQMINRDPGVLLKVKRYLPVIKRMKIF